LAIALLVVGLHDTAAADMLVSQGLGSSAYTASSTYLSNTPDLAFDGNFSNMWNAGDYPVGWIEVNLGQLTYLTRVLLTVEQTPAITITTNEVWLSASSILTDTSGATLSHTFSGPTYDGQLLSVDFSTPILAQYIQIRTTSSLSWVAWNEIQIMAVDAIPEPATILLFGAGMVGFAGTRLGRKQA
jgi:hypothetical protein